MKPTFEIKWGDESYEFFDFSKDAEISDVLEDLVAGVRKPDSETQSALASAIYGRFIRTNDPERTELAEALSGALIKAYPYALKDPSDLGPATIHKLDQLQDGQARLESEASNIRKLLDQRLPDVDQQASSKKTADLVRSLLVEPLQVAGQSDEEAKVAAFEAAGRFADAANAQVEIGSALEAHGLSGIAEGFKSRAVQNLARDGQQQRAVELQTDLVWRQFARGSAIANSSVRDLSELGVSDEVVAAFDALTDWPDRLDVLSQIEAGLDLVSARDRERFVLFIVELAVLQLQPLPVLRHVPSLIARPASREQVTLNLARLDALELDGNQEACDAEWKSFGTWLDTAAEPEVSGLAWSRRGYLLANRGDLAGARDAYERSIAAWGRGKDCADFVADAFWSHSSATSLLGAWDRDSFERSSIARELRSTHSTAVDEARRYSHSAASQRLSNSLPEAHRNYWLALFQYRALGSLSGYSTVARQLGELYASAGRFGPAVAMLTEAGKGKEASALAADVNSDSIAQITAELGTDGAPWKRASTYQVIARIGEFLPPALINQFADKILSDAEVPITSLQGPNPAVWARVAVPRVLPLVDASLLDRAHSITLEAYENGPPEATKAASRALARGTDYGLFDERDILLKGFLDDRYWLDVSASWFANEAEKDPAFRQTVSDYALAGEARALEILAYLPVSAETDDSLDALFDDAARPWAEVRPRTETQDGDRIVVKHAMGIRFELGGLLARHARPETRDAVIANLLVVASDKDESVLNRAAALNAIFNVAPQLSEDEASRAVELATALARGNYELHDFDRDLGDPLSRSRVLSGTHGVLDAAALRLLGRLGETGTVVAELDLLVREAMISPFSSVRVQALVVAHRNEAVRSEIDWPRSLVATDASERVQALQTMAHISHPDLRSWLERLSRDPDSTVRWTVARIAGEREYSQLLADLAANDPDAYVRKYVARQASDGAVVDA